MNDELNCVSFDFKIGLLSYEEFIHIVLETWYCKCDMMMGS